MRALSVVGYKKTGKTWLLERVARELTAQGLRVAVAKHSHHGFDKAETDTQRLLAVSQAVVGLSESETILCWPERRYLLDILPLLEADVLLVEGGKALGWLPRVVLARSVEDVAELGAGLALGYMDAAGVTGPVPAATPGVPRLEGPQDVVRLVLERGFQLPGLDCHSCGRDDCAALAREIVAGDATPGDCASVGGSFSVTVNGQPLGMNPFVERIIGSGIRAMLAELKGFAPGSIEIKLEV